MREHKQMSEAAGWWRKAAAVIDVSRAPVLQIAADGLWEAALIARGRRRRTCRISCIGPQRSDCATWQSRCCGRVEASSAPDGR